MVWKIQKYGEEMSQPLLAPHGVGVFYMMSAALGNLSKINNSRLHDISACPNQRSPLARVRVTQIFPRKTCQPATIGVICLYVRRLNSDGLGAQTRH